MVNDLRKKVTIFIMLFFVIIIFVCIYYKIKENTFETTFYNIDSEKVHENIRVLIYQIYI